jgi:hypothetical protein
MSLNVSAFTSAAYAAVSLLNAPEITPLLAGTKSYISTLVSRFTSPAKNSPGLVVIGISGASGASIIVPPAAVIISSA